MHNMQPYWVFTRYDRRTDRSVRLVGPTIVSCKRFVRPVGQTVGCLISSDCRSDCRSVWTLRPTGRTDLPVGRPITLQRRRYYNQLAGHIDLIDRCGRCGYSLSDRSVRLVWQTVGRSLGRTDRSVRRSERVNTQLRCYWHWTLDIRPIVLFYCYALC